MILDKADAMPQDAQNALRRVIEKFTENTRFCLLCNYRSKIIPALQSRCTGFRFGPPTPKLMVPQLEHAVQEENVDISEDGMKALVTLSSGDMRRALNILQVQSHCRHLNHCFKIVLQESQPASPHVHSDS